MEDVSHSEVLKEREYFKVECKFENRQRWMRVHNDYESLDKAARAGSIYMNQEDVENYRVLKVEQKETIIHP